MYERIVGYFESKICIENIYFRNNCRLWIIGILVMIFGELLVNNIVKNLMSDKYVRIGIILLMDFCITMVVFLFIYFLPIKKYITKR